MSLISDRSVSQIEGYITSDTTFGTKLSTVGAGVPDLDISVRLVISAVLCLYQ